MDKEQFEARKKELSDQTLLGFDQLNVNIQNLNRNLDIINSIGKSIQEPAELWSSFHKAISGINDPQVESASRLGIPGTFKAAEDFSSHVQRRSLPPRSVNEDERIGDDNVEEQDLSH